jgi:hypothetical protein
MKDQWRTASNQAAAKYAGVHTRALERFCHCGRSREKNYQQFTIPGV